MAIATSGTTIIGLKKKINRLLFFSADKADEQYIMHLEMVVYSDNMEFRITLKNRDLLF